ncbi:MAG: (2E,6E)-farnesyl diphosphate synthase [Gammaproteobacteria bacterium]|nr:(2E,6E)-farnesyl diphosphate synthase [Gammaproteobacteria bacterium]
MSLNTFMTRSREQVDSALERWLPKTDQQPQRLHEAMRYTVFNGGKRIRPFLVYATGQALGIPMKTLDGAACAVELIHAYSLVHDDLPAMDDDDLRRGKPTCHVAYDEATAILVGDALQTLAFQVLIDDTDLPGNAQGKLKMIQALANASGSRGMVGGQAIDLDSVGRQLSLEQLETMHMHKTGALIRCSVCIAALATLNLNPKTLHNLDTYAQSIGLAFQIQDDILDEESNTEALGKTQGKDRDNNKPTYPSLMGMDNAKQKAQQLHAKATEALSQFGHEANVLRELSRYIIERHN